MTRHLAACQRVMSDAPRTPVIQHRTAAQRYSQLRSTDTSTEDAELYDCMAALVRERDTDTAKEEFWKTTLEKYKHTYPEEEDYQLFMRMQEAGENFDADGYGRVTESLQLMNEEFRQAAMRYQIMRARLYENAKALMEVGEVDEMDEW